jgi:hypothetical protein
MMRHGLKQLGARREDTAIIGDRMDTDIIAGIESEIETVLVFSGVTQPDDLPSFAYRPSYQVAGVGQLVPYRLKPALSSGWARTSTKAAARPIWRIPWSGLKKAERNK